MLERVSWGELAGMVARPAGEAKPTPVLFVHGMWGGYWHWEEYVQLFSQKGYTSYAFSLRYHAPSREGPVGSTSILDYVADVGSVLDSLGGAPVLVGHSMGGLIAQKVAESRRLSSLVLIAPAPPRGIFPVVGWRLGLRMLKYLPPILLRRAFQPSFGDSCYTQGKYLPQEEWRELYRRMVPESGRAAWEILIGAVAVAEGQVRCPTLVVGGEEDELIRPAVMRRVASKYGAEFRLYPAHTHWIIRERGWEGVAQDICNWLDRRLQGYAPEPPQKVE